MLSNLNHKICEKLVYILNFVFKIRGATHTFI